MMQFGTTYHIEVFGPDGAYMKVEAPSRAVFVDRANAIRQTMPSNKIKLWKVVVEPIQDITTSQIIERQ